MNFLRKYKYWIAVTILFVVIMTFFVRNSVLDAVQIQWRINELDDQIDMYRTKAREDSIFIEMLKYDDFLEKFARENFYMKYDGEEIYIIPEAKPKQVEQRR